jgi:hypothetical protein
MVAGLKRCKRCARSAPRRYVVLCREPPRKVQEIVARDAAGPPFFQATL